MWMLIKVDVGWGQNSHCSPQYCKELTVLNNTLSYSLPRPGNGQSSFFNGRIANWSSGNGEPCTVDYRTSPTTQCWYLLNNPIPPEWVERTCLASSISGGESVFQTLTDHNFDPSVDYCIELEAQTLNCNNQFNLNSLITIQTARGLVNSNALTQTNNSSQFVGAENITEQTQTFTFNFTPQPQSNPNLWNNQIWLSASSNGTSGSFTSINQVKIWCKTNALTGLNAIELNDDTYRFIGVQNKQFATYNWTINNSGVSGNTNQLTHTFTEPGEYEVCISVTDEYGCCGTQCTTIFICEDLEVPQIEVVENYCSNYTFNITNIDNDATYTWNILGGNPASGTGTQFCTMLPLNGVYTITVTAQNACESLSGTKTFSYECSLDPPSCIDQNNCVKIGTDINSVTFLSDLLEGTCPIIPRSSWFGTFQVNDLCFSVEGKLIIDENIMFSNTHWFMGPGSEIEIAFGGFSVSQWFIDSHLQGCESMWRGIVVKDNNAPGLFSNGGLILLRTTLEDAWRGVELGNNTTIVAEDSYFYDNYIGIYTTPGIGRKNIVVSDLKNNVFRDRRNMLPPYPNQPDYSSRFHTGIFVNGCQRFTIGQDETTKNTFRNLITGIHSLNTSNLFCYGNEFEDNYFNSSVRTRGIHIVGSGSFSIINKKNKFQNLNTGVEVVSSNGGVIIDGNTFVNNRPNPSTFIEGINSFLNQMLRLSISNNNFNFSSGRCIAHDGSATSIFINHNTPHLTGPAYFIFQTNTSVTSRILNNTTTFENGINYRGYVYYFGDCQKVNAYNNRILKPQTFIPTRETSGFLIDGCSKSLFRNNLIEIPSRAFNLLGHEISQDIAYCCNQANSTVPGAGDLEASFYLSSTKGQSFVRQNDLRILRLLGEIREQKNAGNNWTAGSLAVLENPTDPRINQNIFLVDDNQTATNPRPDNVEPDVIEQQWFDGLGTEHPTCATTPNCNLPEFYFAPDDVTVSSFWPAPDPIDSVIIIVDPARPHCSVVLGLYQRLLQVDSITDPLEYWYLVTTLEKWRNWQGESWFNSCLGTIFEYNPDVDLWNDSEKEKDGIRDFDNGIRSNANELIEDIALLNDELNTYALDSLMQLDSIAFVHYQELTELQEEFDSLMESVNLEVINRVNTLIPIIQSLPAPLPFLVDKKAAWIAELKIMSGGVTALDSSEWNVIRNIARKCPEFYGQAVFIAKNLMLLVGEQIETDTSCSIVKIRSKANKETDSKLWVSPNPGSGTFNFQVSGDTFISEISIFNVSGVKVHDTKISDISCQIIIDISGFVPGIYFYEVKTGNNKIEKGKLIKI